MSQDFPVASSAHNCDVNPLYGMLCNMLQARLREESLAALFGVRVVRDIYQIHTFDSSKNAWGIGTDMAPSINTQTLNVGPFPVVKRRNRHPKDLWPEQNVEPGCQLYLPTKFCVTVMGQVLQVGDQDSVLFYDVRLFEGNEPARVDQNGNDTTHLAARKNFTEGYLLHGEHLPEEVLEEYPAEVCDMIVRDLVDQWCAKYPEKRPAWHRPVGNCLDRQGRNMNYPLRRPWAAVKLMAEREAASDGLCRPVVEWLTEQLLRQNTERDRPEFDMQEYLRLLDSDKAAAQSFWDERTNPAQVGKNLHLLRHTKCGPEIWQPGRPVEEGKRKPSRPVEEGNRKPSQPAEEGKRKRGRPKKAVLASTAADAGYDEIYAAAAAAYAPDDAGGAEGDA